MSDDEYDDEESLPFVRGSATSEAAADAARVNAASLRVEIYHHVAALGAHGATRDEIEVAVRSKHQTASARVRDLVRMGCLVEQKDHRRTTRNGCEAVVCTAVPGADPTRPPPPYDAVANALEKLHDLIAARKVTLEQAIARLRAGFAAPPDDDAD